MNDELTLTRYKKNGAADPAAPFFW